MGRWSRELAGVFVDWLCAGRDEHWLDVGCGTGSLTRAICDRAQPASVTGCDPSRGFIDFARHHTRDPRASYVCAGVGTLPQREDGYGCITSLLALNFFPDPAAALREMGSLCAESGVVSACVWDYADGMQMLRTFWDAAREIDSAAASLDEGVRFQICDPDRLRALFENAGLRDVRCEPIEIAMTFSSFDEYWEPLLGATGPAPSYVTSLDAAARSMLRNRLAERLRPGPDGGIHLTAKAWAVRGSCHPRLHRT